MFLRGFCTHLFRDIVWQIGHEQARAGGFPAVTHRYGNPLFRNGEDLDPSASLWLPPFLLCT